MKNLDRFSILANVLLCGLVLWLARQNSLHAASRPAALQTSSAPVAPVPPVAAPEVVAAPTPKPFRWSDLESTDYPTYLANLRNIGCPEQTIRDILTADVDSVFAQRREQVERATTNSSETQAELERLRGQEGAFLAELLGEKSPAQKPVSKNPPWLARRNIRPVLPLAFDNIDPADLPLNSAQVAAVDDVRKCFEEELGVQDVNDPAYAQKWTRAQQDADDRLRGLLGSKVYLQYRLQAANRK